MERTTDTLVIRLLGDVDVRVDDEAIGVLASPRLRSLLGYLIVRRDRPVSRQRLAFLFWPDSTEKQARTNLRHALHHLRQALGEPQRYLCMDHQAVQWVADSGADVDVERFERWAQLGLATGERAPLTCAAEAYRGDLLEGCYDEWVTADRDRLRGVAATVLEALSDEASRRRDWASAIVTADRLRRLDPLDESAYRRLIELHAAAGDGVRAMRTYHECVAVLGRELGVGPADATVAAYETAIAAMASHDRPPTAGSGPLTIERLPLVGRSEESARLDAAWQVSRLGRPRVVLVAGEPGIGKSRLVEDFRSRLGREGVATVGARAYEAEGAVPYGPVLEVLRAEPVHAALARVDQRTRGQLGRVMPELASAGEAPVEVVDKDAARRELFAAIATALLATERPLVVALDDIHWCDVDTLDLVEAIVRAALSSAAPLLVVITARHEELLDRPRLRALLGRLHSMDVLTELALDRLGAGDAASLAGLALGEGSTEAAVAEVVAAAEGNPLFLVEMARSGLVGQRSQQAADEAQLPPRVQSVIETRLDQLSPIAHEVATVCAVVGRAFTLDVVGRLVPDEHDVVAALDELWRRGIVRERSADSYDFTHDKIREVTYRRIGPARRRRLHGAVATALTAEPTAGDAAQVASHLERAGDVVAALDAYRLAVTAAAHVFAHRDVIACCRRALRLIAARPPGPERDDAELDFLVPLGVAIMAGPGIAEADTAVYERARVLRGQRGLLPDPSTLRLSANAAIARRDYREARRFGEILLDCGRHDDDAILVTEGCYLIGVTSFWLGDIERSRTHLEAALASNRPEHTPIHLERFGQDPRAVCLTRLALTRFHLGAQSTVEPLLEQALAVAADTGHVYTDVYVRMFGAWLLAESGRPRDALRVVEGMATGTITNLIDPIARSFFAGWAHLADGDPVSALPLLRDALHRARHDGLAMWEPLTLLLLADAHVDADRPDAALQAAVAARDIAGPEMPFHLPEALRRSGELVLVVSDDRTAALGELERAVEVAREQGNLVAELRARTSALRTARAHDADGGRGREAELRLVCERFPPGGGDGALGAARAELARDG